MSLWSKLFLLIWQQLGVSLSQPHICDSLRIKQKKTNFKQKIVILLAPTLWHTHACIPYGHVSLVMYTYNRCFLGLIWYISSHWQRSIVWRCLLREKFWSLIWQREGCYIVYMRVYNTCSSCLSFVCGMIPGDVSIVWGQHSEPRTLYTPGARLDNMQMKHSA